MKRVPIRTSIVAFVLAVASVVACSRKESPAPRPQSSAPALADDMTSGGPDSTRRPPADTAEISRLREDLRRNGPTREVFNRHLPALGARAILDVLEADSPSCHAQAHDLGRALMALRQDIGAALRECGTGCTSACMHGAVGEAFGGSDLDSIAARMNSFCETGVMRELYPLGNCAHGIGHALMFASHRDVDAALNVCARFDKKGMRYYCATGVYMEMFMGVPPPSPTKGTHEPCLAHPEVAAACYRYRASSLVTELGGLDALQKSCLSQTPALQRGCFHGIGAVLLGFAHTDPAVLSRYCSAGDRADRTLCVEGAIEKQADFDREVARSICAKQTGEIREFCDTAVKHGMYDLEKPSLTFYLSDPS
jgi:hypothetical protein